MAKDKTDNLIPFNKLPKSAMKEITRNGGIKSGEVRRKQKTVKDILNLIDKQKLPKEDSLSLEKFFQI